MKSYEKQGVKFFLMLVALGLALALVWLRSLPLGNYQSFRLDYQPAGLEELSFSLTCSSQPQLSRTFHLSGDQVIEQFMPLSEQLCSEIYARLSALPKQVVSPAAYKPSQRMDWYVGEQHWNWQWHGAASQPLVKVFARLDNLAEQMPEQPELAFNSDL